MNDTIHPSEEPVAPLSMEQRLAALASKEKSGLVETLSEALKETHAPEKVLVRLEHFLECCLNPNLELDLMASAPQYVRLLATIFAQSQFLTDIVCRNPEYMNWLWEETDLTQTPAREEMVADLLRQTRGFDAFEARCNSMRRFKRREILRIAVRDIFAHVPLPALTEDLSNLADATLEGALDSGYAGLTPRYGRPQTDSPEGARECGFVILAMGKLGGRELNFSSDIDLLFIYAGEGETSGGTTGTVSNAEFFHKLGEQIIHAVSAQTSEGQIFRVDMRLRPHGRMGPLAVNIDSCLAYYESHGQAWERQALIKARPAAGDRTLGEDLIARTRPFVFPRYFDDETLEEIRVIKRQMEEQIASRGQSEIEVKLGRGGIRDVEFTVQMLQLLNGGRIPELRTTNTLRAIRALGEHNLLTPLDAATLTSNYTFMRNVEHRLQIEGSQQLHVLPSQPEALDEFAQRLGFVSGDAFMETYRGRAEETRKILDQFFAAKGSGNLWINDLLHPQHDGSVGLARLAALGFNNVETARDELHLLYGGTRENPHGLHARQQFTAVAPDLLKALSQARDPDATLLRLGQVLSNIRAPGGIYDLLKWNPSLCTYLTTLVSNSDYLSEFLIRDPGLFETFGSAAALEEPETREGLEQQLAALSHAVDPDAALYRLRDGETLRIGMRDLIVEVGVLQIGRELTLLAEVCLASALAVARRRVAERYGETTAQFAVLGLGKLGGSELGYGSDLDLVFVYDAEGDLPSGIGLNEYFATVAQYTMRALKEPTRYGILYDIDARLRPDGKKGMLTISRKRLHEYYTQEAQAWERLALVKVRAVAGDAEFGRAIEAEARDVAFQGPLTRETLENIDEVRRKIVESTTPLDLKKDEGGLAEIEFTVRLLQLRHCAALPALKQGNFMAALQTLAEANHLTWEQAKTLGDAYTLLRRVENRIRMLHGRPGTNLPSAPDEQTDLTHRLNLEGDLLELVARRKAAAHAVYEHVFEALLREV